MVCYDRAMTNEDLVLAALTMQGIPAYARLLLTVLIITGDDTGAGRTTIGSKRDLAKIVGVSPRTIRRSVHALEQAGLLTCSRRTGPNGGCVASMYTILIDNLES